MILQIIGAVLVLSFLIFIHELGHFWAARKNGVKVEEFAIGFPPNIWKKKKGDTIYKINLIPFGGYVKLFGEDSFDPKVVSDKKSFASKTPWQKIQILIAGVVMNFLVFWIFLSVAIFNGASPFVFSTQQMHNLFLDSHLSYEVGFSGEKVTEAYESWQTSDVEELHKKIKTGDINDFAFLPSFYVNTVDAFWSDFVSRGDYIVMVNDLPVISVKDFVESIAKTQGSSFEVTLYRDGNFVDVEVPFSFGFRVESLVEGMAKNGGVLIGDVLRTVNNEPVSLATSIRDINKQNAGKAVAYTFERGDELIEINLTPPVDGITGMYLVSSFDFPVLGFGYSLVEFPFTVGEYIREYKFYQVPFVALQDGWTISKLTAAGFLGTIFDVFFKFEVSDEIGGPVQVVKMSYEFVGLGGNDLLSFIALISLSLAVINLLPIPALDGGRILFVLVEALRGKPLDRKLEAYIHAFGFMVLMTLILVVTVFDFLRL